MSTQATKMKALARGPASAPSAMSAALTNRLRALSCYQAAAPYLAPKLAAIEVAPASTTTINKFERAITTMSEAQVIEHLEKISNGSSAIQLLEDHSGDNG
jgi:hypothetical protein